GRVVMPSRFRYEPRLCLNRVTLQHQHIIDAQEVQVDERILRFFFGKSATNDVRHSIDLILVLNSGTNTYCTRTFPRRALLKQSILLRLVYILFPVIRNVNKRWLEFHQRVNIRKQRFNILSLQWRKDFNSKEGFSVGAREVLGDLHVFSCLCVYVFTFLYSKDRRPFERNCGPECIYVLTFLHPKDRRSSERSLRF